MTDTPNAKTPAPKAAPKKAELAVGDTVSLATTGAFMLVDPYTGAFYEPTPLKDALVTAFVLDRLSGDKPDLKVV